jgi:diguanylate cyclase (GGDEF)-like protein
VMRIVAERAASITGATTGMVALVEGDDLVYRAVAGTKPAIGLRTPRASSVAGRSVGECKPVRIDDAQADDRVDADTRARTGAGSLVCVPLLYGEHAVGVLEIVSLKVVAFTDEDVETLALLAQIIAIALHRAYTYPRPKLDSLHDTLTGLANRRAFDERIHAELSRNKRYGHSFSLAVIHLDGLEVAMDRVGQAAGDEFVKDVGAILNRHTRVIDACFRLAGDEFAIVMPGTSLEGARILAERCRAHIGEAKLAAVTAGFGVVEAADESAVELAARATAALDADRAVAR